MDLKKLQEQVVAYRDARDWKQFHNPKDSSIALMLEANELLEHFLWKNETEMAEHVAERREEIGEELADVLYWVLLLSNDIGIDIEGTFHKKMEKNAKKYPVEKARGSHKKYTAYLE